MKRSGLSDADFDEAKGLLRSLVRIDTTNPPGNEAAAAALLREALAGEGIDAEWIEPAPGRANLVARLAGDGSKDPLLLSCHLDVVPANPARWTHPPFSADEADGCIWGRGTIDMKGFAAMAFTVFRRLRREGVPLKRDVIFAAVADEEIGCELGSAHLVRHHPELIRAEYGINEVGGYTVEIQGKRFYLVQTAERGLARLRIRLKGPPGHAASPQPDSVLLETGDVLRKLVRARLPIHVSEPARRFLREMARHLPAWEAWVPRGLTQPALSAPFLQSLIPAGVKRSNMQAMLSNTVNPTRVSAGEGINVIPGEAVIEVDGRTVPGSSGAELVKEVRHLLGPGPEIELTHEEAPTVFPIDTPVYEILAQTLKDHDPEARVLPFMIYGVTDSRNYAKLGTTCYGFYPLPMPPDLPFADLFHGDDERIPLDGFRFGIGALEDAVRRIAT